jgi:hypothetical protein
MPFAIDDDFNFLTEYRRQSRLRRAEKHANAKSKVSLNQQNDRPTAATVVKNTVVISYEGGHVTVDTRAATPLSETVEKSKVFGRSSISIPELHLHRGK